MKNYKLGLVKCYQETFQINHLNFPLGRMAADCDQIIRIKSAGYPNLVIQVSEWKPLSVFWISNVKNHIHNNAAVGGEAGFWAFGHVGVDTPASLSINYPPLNSDGIAEWRNNKASAANDGFRWQFMVKNDHPRGVYSGKYGDESSPRLSKVHETMNPINEEGVFKGGLVSVQLTGWKIHHCHQSAMWIAQEKLR